MHRYRVNQHWIVLNLYGIITSFGQGIYYCESFTKSKFDVKYDNTVRSVGTCSQKWSNFLCKTFENKSIAKDYQAQIKWTEHEIF